MAKVVCFDIEASNLKGNIGRMLAFGWKVLGEKKAHVVSIADFPEWKKDKIDDSKIAEKAYDILTQADVVVAHYGKFFDVPFINTRLVANGHFPLPPLNLVDTWLIAKKRLALNSNRLATLTQFFGLPSKTPISWDDWARAQAGDLKALSYIKEHCRVDVEVLEMAYLKLKALWPEHPRLAEKAEGENCPQCASTDTHKRGYLIGPKQKKQRWQCQKCGSWFSGKIVKEAA